MPSSAGALGGFELRFTPDTPCAKYGGSSRESLRRGCGSDGCAESPRQRNLIHRRVTVWRNGHAPLRRTQLNSDSAMRSLGPDETESIVYAFTPLHKRGLGTGIGVAAAIVVFLLTAIPLLRGDTHGSGLGLLSQYFSGYSVSWGGALIGAGWAGFSGFVMGWFLAFLSNFMLAIRLLALRARADMAQTRDFLDHI